jgi:putative ABC transport system permease protein
MTNLLSLAANAFSMILGLAFLGLIVGLLFWEKGRRSVVLALKSLWLHKLRATLSVMGIIIGTGAVILLMAFGKGSMEDALEDIRRQGATNIIIRSVKPPDDSSTQRRTMIAKYGLEYKDYERLQTIGTVTRSVPMRIFPSEVRRLERMHNGRIVGTTPEYADVNKIEMAVGRFLVEEDNHRMLNVAVLGSELAEELFPFENPVGQSVRLGQHFYKVVGVISERMPTGAVGGTTAAAEEYNNDVYIPLATCRVRFGDRIYIRTSGSRSGEEVQLHQVTLTISDMDRVRAAGDVVRALLEKRAKKDTAVTIPLDRLEEAERAQERYTMLLVVIAGISLVVGGIGIMNIMLATVTERTREIGIRRALGAKRRDITMQFLIEAVVQTTVGGLVGVGLGLGLSYLIPFVSAFLTGSAIPVMIYWRSVIWSLEVSIGVGVLFGWYPSQRAASLDPIEALRHE